MVRSACAMGIRLRAKTSCIVIATFGLASIRGIPAGEEMQPNFHTCAVARPLSDVLRKPIMGSPPQWGACCRRVGASVTQAPEDIVTVHVRWEVGYSIASQDIPRLSQSAAVWYLKEIEFVSTSSD